MKDFKENLPLLISLFGEQTVLPKLDRLIEIHSSTECAWIKNVKRLQGTAIKYILIGEAAPWSESGVPRYFYNQIESKFHKSVWNAIFPSSPLPNENELSFCMLANNGFLLIDTLPYAMDYSGKRNKSQYFKLISESVKWWTQKLENDYLTFAENIKIAFAFKINGLKTSEALGFKLELKNGQTILLDEKIIAADDSGYTNSQKLREIYLSNPN